MNYLNLDEIKVLVSKLSRVNNEFELIDGIFEPIKINNFSIVCSAGSSTYSTPSLFYEKIDNYQTIAINIMELDYKKSIYKLLTPSKGERFYYFNWTKYFKYTDSYQTIVDGYFGHYVPKDMLYQIVKDIYKISRLGTFL